MLLAALNDVAAHDHFLENEVRLVEVENQIQLAHVSEVFVENLDEVMDDVQHNQLVVFLLDAGYEIQRRIPIALN